jgi:hypothetical protein
MLFEWLDIKEERNLSRDPISPVSPIFSMDGVNLIAGVGDYLKADETGSAS